MAFSHNPLSLAIPPTELQRWYSEQVVLRLQETTPTHPGLKERSRSLSTLQSSVHPSAAALRSASLSLHHGHAWERGGAGDGDGALAQWHRLTQEPCAWSAEFLGLETLPRGYSIPDTWQEGRRRLRANLDSFWGNYVRIFVFILFSSFYKQPVALLGLYLLWRLSEEVQRQLLEYSLRRRSWRRALVRWSLYAMMWVIALCFRVVLAAIVAVVVSCIAVGLHGVLREPLLVQHVGR